MLEWECARLLFCRIHQDCRNSSKFRSIDINPRYSGNADTLVLRSGICKTLKTQVLMGRGRLHCWIICLSVSLRFWKYKVLSGMIISSALLTHRIIKRIFASIHCKLPLTVTVKDQYPLRVNFVIRKSNSPYFKISSMGNALRQVFLLQIYKAAAGWKDDQKIPGLEYLESAQSLLKKNWMNSIN